jgi:hypothetical protein
MFHIASSFNRRLGVQESSSSIDARHAITAVQNYSVAKSWGQLAGLLQQQPTKYRGILTVDERRFFQNDHIST